MSRFRYPVPTTAMAVLAALAGCKGANEGAVEGATGGGGQVAVDARARAPGLEQEAGFLTMASTVPDDFPADVPVYPGSRPTLSGRSSTAAAGKAVWSLTVESSDSKDQALAYYDAHLGGFQKASTIDMGESALVVWRSAAYDLTLTVGKGADRKTTITLNVAGR